MMKVVRFFRKADPAYFEGYCYMKETANWTPDNGPNSTEITYNDDLVQAKLLTISNPAFDASVLPIVDPYSKPLKPGVEIITEQMYDEYEARSKDRLIELRS